MSARIAYLATSDQEDLRNLSIFLPKLGFEIRFFSSAKTLLSAIREKKPDVLLLDENLEMRGVGILALQAIRRVLSENFAILMLTREKDLQAVRRLFDWGATDVLCGDHDRTTLTQRLSRHFQLNLSEDELIARKMIPRMASAVTVETNCKITAIDIAGVTLSSAHMLSRGALVHLDSPVLREATKLDRPILVSVQGCTWNRETGIHTCQATFDGVSEETRDAVKNWILNQI